MQRRSQNGITKIEDAMKKILIVLILVVLVASVFIYFKKSASRKFVQCLAEAGVVIYGSKTCGACAQLVEEYGGETIIKPIYLDCSEFGSQEELKRCFEEKQTEFVPEIQINGELFEGWGNPEVLSEITACQL